MKNCCAVISLLLCSSLCMAMADEKPEPELPVVVFTEDPWPPYVKEEEFGVTGVAVEIVRRVCEQMGLKMEMRILPWKRSLSYVEEGIADGIPVLKKTPERERYMLFSDPYLVAHQTFFYHAGRDEPIEWLTFEDLQPYSIGKQAASEYGADFARAITTYNLEVIEKTYDLQVLQMVARGRLDMFLGNTAVTWSLIDSEPELKGKFKTTKKSLSTSYFHIGISKRSPLARRMDEINKILHKMAEDGTLQWMQRRYR